MDCEKLNIAAIGNVVSQLHLHVIGRRREEALWPRVVWGNLPTNGALRTAEDAALLAARLRLAQCL
jgi:diadenosine tetraphosphate (Ap4A) HIT family hydrolase